MDVDAAVVSAKPSSYADRLRAIGDLHNGTVFARVGPFVITTYAFISGAAFLSGFITALWVEAMSGRDPARSARLHVLITLPAVFVGLRLFTIATELQTLRQKPLRTIVRPGYMLHGGMFGGAAALSWVSHVSGVPLLFGFDCAALALGIGEAIGRVGCHVYGCCWGRPTAGLIGIRYTNPDASILRHEPHLAGVKVHPTQLYAALYAAVLFVLMLQILRVRPFDGFLTATYAILHSAGRFGIERFRHDNRGRLGSRWTHTNLYSAILVVTGVWLLASGPLLPATPLNSSIRWLDVALNQAALRWTVPFGVFFFFAYGVSYKKVGSWVPGR